MAERGRGRPPHPDVLTPAEWRVLEHLRAGRTNAEIAVRLGISPNTVRYHVSNMLAKLHVDSREGLALWQGRPSRVDGRFWLPLLRFWPLGAAAGAGIAGAIVIVALVLGRAPGDADLGVTAPAGIVESASCLDGVPPSAGYRIWTGAELRSLGMVDLGPAFSLQTPRSPVACTAMRATLSGVRLSGDGSIDAGDFGEGWDGTPGLPGTTVRQTWFPMSLPDGTDLRVTVYPAIEGGGPVTGGAPGRTEVTYSASSTIGLAPPALWDNLPELLMQVRDNAGDEYTSAVDEAGHLWVSSAPVGPGVYSGRTGARIDTSGAAWSAAVLRLAPSNSPWNPCIAGEPCTSTQYIEAFIAPVHGTLLCEGRSHVIFASESWGVHLVGVGGTQTDCSGREDAPEGREVRLTGYWNVRGYVSGEQIDVMTDENGRLYFDIDPPEVGCPCVNGR